MSDGNHVDTSRVCPRCGHNEKHQGGELCIVCLAETPHNALKCARGGCDNLRHAGQDFCLPCLIAGAARPAAHRCCDNLPAIAD